MIKLGLFQGYKDSSIYANQSVWYTILINWKIKTIWSPEEMQKKPLTKFNTYLWLEKEMTIHSSTIAWKIPWTEEPGRLQSMGSQRVGHDWATSLSLMIKTLQKIIIEGTNLNIVKAIYDKPKQTLFSMVKNWKHSPLDQEQDKGVHFHHNYSTVLEVLAIAIREEKEIKGIQIRKEEVKLSLFADYMILYLLLLLLSHFSRVRLCGTP